MASFASRLIGNFIFGGLWIVAWVLFIIGVALLFGDTFDQGTQTLWIIAFSMMIAASFLRLIADIIAIRSGGKAISAVIPILFGVFAALGLVGTGVFGKGDAGSLRGLGVIWIIAGVIMIIASTLGIIRNRSMGRGVLADVISLLMYILASIVFIVASALIIGANEGIIIAAGVLLLIASAFFLFGSFLKALTGIFAGEADEVSD